MNCPCSSAAVERSFSIHKYVLAPRRNRLSGKNANDLLMLKSNRVVEQVDGRSSQPVVTLDNTAATNTTSVEEVEDEETIEINSDFDDGDSIVDESEPDDV